LLLSIHLCITLFPYTTLFRSMNFSASFIARPVATILLTIGLALAGASAFFLLPVSPLPNVDYPTISVTAQLPGASPETVSTSVRSEEHTSELQSLRHLVCRLL